MAEGLADCPCQGSPRVAAAAIERCLSDRCSEPKADGAPTSGLLDQRLALGPADAALHGLTGRWAQPRPHLNSGDVGRRSGVPASGSGRGRGAHVGAPPTILVRVPPVAGLGPSASSLTRQQDDFAFDGVHFVPQWTSTRKVKDGPVTADLYGFLNTVLRIGATVASFRACPGAGNRQAGDTMMNQGLA
jgi:hypothetical protein